jgi:hypothetical protein
MTDTENSTIHNISNSVIYKINDACEIDESDVINAPIEYFDLENNDDKTHNVETSRKIQELFPNKKQHMNTLFKLYKFIFQKYEKTIWDKDNKEVVDDIVNTSFSLDFTQLMEEQSKNVYKQLFKSKTLHKRIEAIPAYIDFAYLYYLRYLDSSAPIHKLPTTLFKYKLLMHSLGEPYNELQACFEKCIENKFMSELRVETPPFYLRTELSEAQIEEKINFVVQPLCKDLLKRIFELYRKEFPNSVDTKKEKTEDEKVEELKKTFNSSILESMGDEADNFLRDIVRNNSKVANNNTAAMESNLVTDEIKQESLPPREDNIV